MSEQRPNHRPNGRKKILVLSSTYPRWANDHEPNFVHELSKRINKTHDVTVIAPREKNSRTSEILDGVQIYRHRYAPNKISTLISNGGMTANVKRNPLKLALLPFFILSQLLLTYRAIRKIKPDILHAHWIIPQGFIAMLSKLTMKNSPPLIVTSHGGDLYTFNGNIFKIIKQLVLKNTDVLAVVSPAMKSHFNNESSITSKITVLPMGVDTEKLFTPNIEIHRNKEQLLFVGRLVEKKGVKYLLKAIPEILIHHPTATLVIIGDGPHKGALHEIIKDLQIDEHVEFLGGLPSKDLIPYYQESSVFIAPFITAKSGDREGLGLVVIEALSCNCPIIVSKNESLLEVRKAFIDNKWVQTIPERDSSAIAKSVIRTLTTLKYEEPTFTAQHRSVTEQYSWSTASKNYLNIYEKCTNLASTRDIGSLKYVSNKGEPDE